MRRALIRAVSRAARAACWRAFRASRIYIAAITLAAGGCVDTATTIHVAPSAQVRMAEIQAAAGWWNEVAGVAAYRVQGAVSAARIDGAAVVRLSVLRPGVGGYTRHTRTGVIVLLSRDAAPIIIAHELGHAAGLEHSDDPENIMHERPRAWALSPDQIRFLGGAP